MNSRQMGCRELLPQLERVSRQAGATFFGVADLSPAKHFVRSQGGELVASFPRAISVGIALPHEIVDRLPERGYRSVSSAYKHHAYAVINSRLDAIASQLAGILQERTFRALPVAASQLIDQQRLIGHISHKLVAHLAGLGWIGKNCLLVTPQAGPRVRWATILTDAPLETATERMEDMCGVCSACVDVCPNKALSGLPFRYDEPREARFDASRCFEHTNAGDDEAVCGLCLYACPHGKTRLSSRETSASDP